MFCPSFIENSKTRRQTVSIKMSCTILIYAVCIFNYILSWCSSLIGVNTAQRSCSNTLGQHNKAISSEYILGKHRTELSLPYSLFSLGAGIFAFYHYFSCKLQTFKILSISCTGIGQTGPEVIKLFSCSTQLSMKFQMLINLKISRNSAFFRLR